MLGPEIDFSWFVERLMFVFLRGRGLRVSDSVPTAQVWEFLGLG